MKLRTVEDKDLKSKTVLYRAPYDIDVKEVGGALEVVDDSRIRATLPTLEYLLRQDCKIVILTYVKRPDGKIVEKLRTTPHARRLSELLARPVLKVDDCIGREVEDRVRQMKAGEIIMLENVRFHKEEMEDDDVFAEELCRGKDIVVFDGFPQAMRAHSSTTGILRHLPGVAGRYMEQEVNTLSGLLENPARPLTVIIGGAKISDKVDAVNNLLRIADSVLVGGAVANVFLKALGRDLGASFVEDVFVDEKRREKRDWVMYAQEILRSYGSKIVYPEDSKISDGKNLKTIDILSESCPPGWSVLDIGPKTAEHFSEIIKKSGTVFLGGPMGKFEDDKFLEGSGRVVAAMKEGSGNTIIAGGDTIDMAKKCGSLDDFTHVSLAGGATLEFLAGKTLPVMEFLTE